MKKLLILFLFFHQSLIAQPGILIDDYSYMGPAGALYKNAEVVTEGSKYSFCFCAINVPDSLTIFLGNKQLRFYFGSWVSNSPRHFAYIDQTLIDLGTLMPSGYTLWGGSECGTTINGNLLIDIIIPDGVCLMSWRVRGNLTYNTHYSLRVYLTHTANPVTFVDTIFSYSCTGYHKTYEPLEDCHYLLTIYRDSSIQTPIEIRQPKCGPNGSILFANYPEFNQYKLAPGIYPITVSNTVCAKEFNIELFDSSACNIYLPNVFKPNDDGLNDTWFIGCDKDLDYSLMIFDRWGDLVFKGDCITNQTGWDGFINGVPADIGVYAFTAIIKSIPEPILVHGDFTLIR